MKMFFLRRYNYLSDSNKISDSQHKYQKFNIFFLALTSFSMLAIGLFNILVDPYGIFQSPVFLNFNSIKPEKEKNSMLYKAVEIRRIQPKIIILGSSRVEGGIPEDHPALINPKITYNLGLEGANMYEVMRYFEHALESHSNINQVIIGLDFFMFNSNLDNLETFTEARLSQKESLQDMVNYSLSIDALLSSSRTIGANIQQSNNLYEESTTSKFKRWLTNFLNYKGFYKRYKLSPERLDNFRRIINLCHQKGIKVKVFISPAHATDAEAIRAAGLWSIFEQWKREVVEIVPVWDFSGYNSVTTEKISNNMKNYVDSSHYSKLTGNWILNRIFHTKETSVPKDFGVLLTQKNIEPHLSKIRVERQAWAQKNSDEVKLVQDIKHHIEIDNQTHQ